MILLFLQALCGVALAGDAARAVGAAVAERLGVPTADVEVSGISLPADVDWRVELPSVGALWGSVPVVLRGGSVRQVVRPQITVYAQLPVAAEAVKAGAPVPVTTARLSRARLRGEEPVDPGSSWQARADLAAGTPLTTARVRPMPDAVSGTSVWIRTGSNGLTVQAPGQLAEDAFSGARVRVVNLATRAQLVGTYEADGSVRVGGL